MEKTQVIAIGGLPGTGKTTLVKKLIKFLRAPEDISYKTFKATYYKKDDVIIAGIYDGAVNDGTDKLSMAVQPAAQEWMMNLIYEGNHQNALIIFEGDRLFNASFLEFLRKMFRHHLNIFILHAAEWELIDRYQKRGTNQSMKFIKSRDTKIRNIANTFPYTLYPNDTEADQKVILTDLLDMIKFRQH